MKDKDWCDTCKEPWASDSCNTCKYGEGDVDNYKPATKKNGDAAYKWITSEATEAWNRRADND